MSPLPRPDLLDRLAVLHAIGHATSWISLAARCEGQVHEWLDDHLPELDLDELLAPPGAVPCR